MPLQLTPAETDALSHTTAIFKSKSPYATAWLSLEIAEGKRPTSLLADLAAAGWAEQTGFRPPPLNGRDTIDISIPGSGLFQGWTADEKKKNMATARRILAKYGFKGVSTWKLTLADLL